jgi:predicted naringenin-chalcone synthase
MSVKIVTVAKELPQYSRTTDEILPFLDAWLVGQEERFIRKVKKIFEGAMVDKRYSIMDPVEVFTKTSFEERNAIYVREVIALGEKVLDKTLKKANWKPSDLDYIITVSCTGIMIPSLDAYLVNAL